MSYSRNSSERVLARQTRLVRLDLDVRVDVVQAVARRLDLRAPHVLRPVHDLTLEVRRVHHVEVHDAERADARRREVHPRRRAQAPRADHQHARRLQTPLPLHADLGHDEVAAVTRDLVVRERGQLLGRYRRSRTHFGLRRRAARDGRDDGDGVAVFDRRVEPLRVAYVLVVDVDVDEIPQRVLLAVEVPAQLRVLARHLVERLAHGARLDRDLGVVARELPERRRDENCDRHLCKAP